GDDVNNLSANKNNIKIDEMEWYVDSTGSYQKGFTKNELVAYLKDALGDSFKVESANTFGKTSAVVTKLSEKTKFSLKEQQTTVERLSFDEVVQFSLKDFGEKIGGARKDTWQKRGILSSDIDAMNSCEVKRYIKKENIWKRLNYVKAVADGGNRGLLYLQNEIYKILNTKPYIKSYNITEYGL
ncbi:MAG TPA: hypothetical protein GX692_08305, partial [Acholeplasmataceae bacterium]|nr:hypothetical protein [Acholeplasmataceae bacterium]